MDYFVTKAVYLNLRIEISYDNRIYQEVYSKPGDAYADLPHNSFHVRTSFATWIRGLLYTALTQSSNCDRLSKGFVCFLRNFEIVVMLLTSSSQNSRKFHGVTALVR
jgi:hypothetical protein